MKRLNITMPDSLAEKIKDFPNKSSFIAQALREKVQRMEREKLDRLLAEGYRATRKEDKATNREWGTPIDSSIRVCSGECFSTPSLTEVPFKMYITDSPKV